MTIGGLTWISYIMQTSLTVSVFNFNPTVQNRSSVSGPPFYLPLLHFSSDLYPLSLALVSSSLSPSRALERVAVVAVIVVVAAERKKRNQKNVVGEETKASNEENHKHVRDHLWSEHWSSTSALRSPRSTAHDEDGGLIITLTQEPQKEFGWFCWDSSLLEGLWSLQTPPCSWPRYLYVQVNVLNH